MDKLSLEEKNRIAGHISILDESLRDSQVDIYEFGRRVDKLWRLVREMIEKREAALDGRVCSAGDYD